MDDFEAQGDGTQTPMHEAFPDLEAEAQAEGIDALVRRILLSLPEEYQNQEWLAVIENMAVRPLAIFATGEHRLLADMVSQHDLESLIPQITEKLHQVDDFYENTWGILGARIIARRFFPREMAETKAQARWDVLESAACDIFFNTALGIKLQPVLKHGNHGRPVRQNGRLIGTDAEDARVKIGQYNGPKCRFYEAIPEGIATGPDIITNAVKNDIFARIPLLRGHMSYGIRIAGRQWMKAPGLLSKFRKDRDLVGYWELVDKHGTLLWELKGLRTGFIHALIHEHALLHKREARIRDVDLYKYGRKAHEMPDDTIAGVFWDATTDILSEHLLGMLSINAVLRTLGRLWDFTSTLLDFKHQAGALPADDGKGEVRETLPVVRELVASADRANVIEDTTKTIEAAASVTVGSGEMIAWKGHDLALFLMQHGLSPEKMNGLIDLSTRLESVSPVIRIATLAIVLSGTFAINRIMHSKNRGSIQDQMIDFLTGRKLRVVLDDWLRTTAF